MIAYVMKSTNTGRYYAGSGNFVDNIDNALLFSQYDVNSFLGCNPQFYKMIKVNITIEHDIVIDKS